MHRITGEDEAAKGDGVKEGIKGEWLKGPETPAMPASTADK